MNYLRLFSSFFFLFFFLKQYLITIDMIWSLSKCLRELKWDLVVDTTSLYSLTHILIVCSPWLVESSVSQLWLRKFSISCIVQKFGWPTQPFFCSKGSCRRWMISIFFSKEEALKFLWFQCRILIRWVYSNIDYCATFVCEVKELSIVMIQLISSRMLTGPKELMVPDSFS